MDEMLGRSRGAPGDAMDMPLDDLLASRSHVRVLRVLIWFGDDINLTGRDVARHAGISHTRAQEVLQTLIAAGVVTRYREATWAIYELNAQSKLAPLVRSLFKRERQLTSA